VSVTTAIAIYFIIWWLALFLVLPFGVHSQHEESAFAPGTDPGAPILPRIAAKLVWTTILAGVLFAAGAVFYKLGGFSFLARLAP
jgi:predicted secreted protein